MNLTQFLILQPVIPEEIVEGYREQLLSLLDDQRIGPELRVQDFDEYMPLINGEAQEEVEKFLSEEHTFDEYVEKILYYKEIQDNIPIRMQHVITMGMYDMHREELIKTLVSAAEALGEMLITRCTKDYQNMCKVYVAFSNIKIAFDEKII